MLEDYKSIIVLLGFFGMLLCLSFLIYYKLWEKKHPNAYTNKGSLEEKRQAHKIVMFFMGSIMLYAVGMLFTLSFLAEEKVSLGITIVCSMFALFALSMIIPLFKK